jgi:hypothetical protein
LTVRIGYMFCRCMRECLSIACLRPSFSSRHA